MKPSHNYHPLNDVLAFPEQTPKQFQGEQYADRLAASTVQSVERCVGPLKAKERERLYREYFRRAYVKFVTFS